MLEDGFYVVPSAPLVRVWSGCWTYSAYLATLNADCEALPAASFEVVSFYVLNLNLNNAYSTSRSLAWVMYTCDTRPLTRLSWACCWNGLASCSGVASKMSTSPLSSFSSLIASTSWSFMPTSDVFGLLSGGICCELCSVALWFESRSSRLTALVADQILGLKCTAVLAGGSG